MDINLTLENGTYLSTFMTGKKVLLLSVCKDTITFLKMYNDHKANLTFTVAGVVDFTLNIRTGVKGRLQSVIGKIPIIETWDDFTKALKDDMFLIQFESPAYLAVY